MKSDEREIEKIKIIADIEQYSDKELEFRAIATLDLLKTDSLELVLSILKKQGFQINPSLTIPEILGFSVFNCWHVILDIFKDREKANIFNACLSEVFKYEFNKDDQIFTKYYEPMPENGNFNEFIWPFWLFGKEIAKTLIKPDDRIAIGMPTIGIYFISSINRTLNITLNLAINDLKEILILNQKKNK